MYMKSFRLGAITWIFRRFALVWWRSSGSAHRDGSSIILLISLFSYGKWNIANYRYLITRSTKKGRKHNSCRKTRLNKLKAICWKSFFVKHLRQLRHRLWAFLKRNVYEESCKNVIHSPKIFLRNSIAYGARLSAHWSLPHTASPCKSTSQGSKSNCSSEKKLLFLYHMLLSVQLIVSAKQAVDRYRKLEKEYANRA